MIASECWRDFWSRVQAGGNPYNHSGCGPSPQDLRLAESKCVGMSSTPEPSAELPGQKHDSTSPRNVLSTIASAMFLGGCLLICGLCAGGFYFFRPDVRDDPEAVEPLMAGILDIDIPPEFEKRGVIEWNLAFMMSLRGAYYEMPDTESEGELMFVEAVSFWNDEPDVETHIRQALREKAGGVVELELVGELEQQTIQVRGEPVIFDFETRRDPVSERTYRVIEGVVDGENGQVLIGLRFHVDDWDNSEAIPHDRVNSLITRPA